MSQNKNDLMNPLTSIADDETAFIDQVKKMLGAKHQFVSRLPVDQTLRCLEAIETIDDEAEKQLRLWGWVLGLSIVATIGTSLLFAMQEMFPFLALVLVPIGIFALFKLVPAGRYNFKDGQYQHAKQIIKTLEPDFFPGQPIDLLLDLRLYDDKEFLKDTQKISWSVSSNRYVAPWLQIKGTFVEGTVFRFQQTANLKQKVKRKSKKTKTTSVFTNKYALTLSPPAHRYPDLTSVPTAMREVMKQDQGYGNSELTFPTVTPTEGRVTFRCTSAPERTVSLAGTPKQIYASGFPSAPLAFFRMSFQALMACSVRSTT